MKKIGIVSCYFQPNYGSMLQAFATQKILDLWNIPNETICIDGLSKEIRQAKLKYFRSKIFSSDVIKGKWGFIQLALAKKRNRQLAENVALRNQKFKAFAEQNFRLSEPYASKSELAQKSCDYAAFLVGSDQLWLPSNIAADYYTLNFVDESIRKIAYATSFGVSTLPKKQAEQAKVFLPRIDFLSVREKSGQALIRNLTSINAEVVCDPTLLLTAEQWVDIQKTERIIPEPYIFCYFFGKNRLSRQCAEKLRQITGFKIVALQQLDAYIKQDEDFADLAPYDVDPADFVNLIRNAAYICTDSFHGTVFSVLHHKPFFSFRRFVEKTTMSTNSRLDSLLEILELKNRIITTEMEFARAQEEIDYSSVDEKLDAFRMDSFAFLKKALAGLEYV